MRQRILQLLISEPVTQEKGLSAATPDEITELEMRAAFYDAAGKMHWCTGCKAQLGTEVPRFRPDGYLDTPHSRSKKHRTLLECQFQLDALLGPPTQVPGQSMIRNADKMIEHGEACYGFRGAATKEKMMKWWGEGVSNIGAVLAVIHGHKGVIHATFQEKTIKLMPEDVAAYVPAVVSYDPTNSKYLEQQFAVFAQLPETSETKVGDDHAILIATGHAGAWPCVQLVLDPKCKHAQRLPIYMLIDICYNTCTYTYACDKMQTTYLGIDEWTRRHQHVYLYGPIWNTLYYICMYIYLNIQVQHGGVAGLRLPVLVGPAQGVALFQRVLHAGRRHAQVVARRGGRRVPHGGL